MFVGMRVEGVCKMSCMLGCGWRGGKMSCLLG